ncbi:hypothetical protein BVRB_3g070250 [Beta vulgaris subsp. vulgaris]|uniref:Uncharacterized protein n=2 Tax=Beta vulgaris TaxID=161934 RepID=A0A0J8BF56_BETVV|nr:hypothetical protein BVRB_3g070250 [Beta vulgaris subsp. vulgaris]
MVVLLLAVAAMTVECNYTMASGSSEAAANEMRGDTEGAKKMGCQIGKEAQESAETWTDWGKEKIAGGQENSGNLKGKISEISKEVSTKAKDAYKQGKEKAHEAVDQEEL